MKIIFGAKNYWKCPNQVGSHQFARMFHEHGWETLFLSTPLTPLHFLCPGKYPENFEKFRQSCGKYDTDGFHAYVPIMFSPPFYSSDLLHRIWMYLTSPSLHQYLNKKRMNRADLIWLDSAFYSPLLDFVKYDRCVVRIADFNEDFRLSGFRGLLQRADLIVYPAASLLRLIPERYHAKAVHLPNGVDEKFISQAVFCPEEYQGISGKKVLYVGAVDEWFDWKAVISAAEKLSDFTFFVIGAVKTKLPGLPGNIRILGPKSREKVKNFMAFSDAGIIPFKLSHPIVAQIHPLKLYEYCAAGLPTVASSWEELKLMWSPALLYESAEEFTELLKKAVSMNQIQKEELKKYAIENTWEKRFSRVQGLLGI